MKMHLPILDAIEQAAQNGLRAAATVALEESNERIPKDTEETAESGFVAVEDLTAQVGYKSFIARLQHENLDYEHPKGGEAKFLERAAAEIDVEQIIGEHVRAALDG